MAGYDAPGTDEAAGAEHFSLDSGAALEELVLRYPAALRVGSLPLESAAARAALVQPLLDCGALVVVPPPPKTRKP